MSGLRWGTLAVGLVLTAARGLVTVAVIVWGVLLLGHAVWRSLQSGARANRRSPLALALLELGLGVAAVVGTGFWDSPFVFCPMTGLIVIGLGRGFNQALRAAAFSALAVGLPAILAGPPRAAVRATAQWSIELVLVTLLAGYARRLFGEAEERHSRALDRMSQLSDANDLLVSLHRLAQSLPASLNLDDVLVSTVARLHSLIDCDVTALLIRDDATGLWTVGVGAGTSLIGPLTDAELPPPLVAASQSSVASLAVVLRPGEGVGVDLLARSGLYAPLRARERLVGLVALEHHEPGRYGRRELRLLDGFLDTAALAIDNARWFGRLRALGADEERTRIARDMHDRVGQSLASVAFKLDRLTSRAGDDPLGAELDGLRGEVRGVLGDVRATLSDLRTDVCDRRGLVDTLEAFLERVRGRSGLTVSFVHEEATRLPLAQERELWRIAHEAVTNAEHHARAQSLDVHWRCDGRGAVLEVKDDGEGFSLAAAGRPDSFGITGMRERADAIGASLDISTGLAGTTVRCRLVAA